MSAAHLPKVAGIDVPVGSTADTPTRPVGQRAPGATSAGAGAGDAARTTGAPEEPDPPDDALTATPRSIDQLAAVQDRLASWISALTTLHELGERLARISTLDAAVEELLRTGAGLVGARRGLAVLEPSDGLGPRTCLGYGLRHADLGAIETVPRAAIGYDLLLDGPVRQTPDDSAEVLHTDLSRESGLDPRHCEVATRLGFRASYGLRLATEREGRLGALVWLYDEPAEPTSRQRHLAGLYVRQAAEHVARLIDLSRSRSVIAVLREELLPSRLPRLPGVRTAVRHTVGRHGGGDWYDALPLPEGALGLAVGGVTGSGPSAVAAMGRLRASLRAYAVMEGEDPVAVLSDLEMLLRMTEPARSATVLFAYAEPGTRKLLMAGAGHCPPLIVGAQRAEYVETSLSAPLGMLTCWEAPSVEFEAASGETLLLYTDGLLRATGESVDRAFAMLHAAAADAPRAAREDPELLVDHVLRTCSRNRTAAPADNRDLVLLAARFG